MKERWMKELPELLLTGEVNNPVKDILPKSGVQVVTEL